MSDEKVYEGYVASVHQLDARMAARFDMMEDLRDINGKLITLKNKYKAAFNTAVYALEQALLQLSAEQAARHQRERDLRSSLSVMQRQRDGAYDRCRELAAERDVLRREKDEASQVETVRDAITRQVQELLSTIPQDWHPRIRLERSITCVLETGEAPAADEGRDTVLAGGPGASYPVSGGSGGGGGQSGSVIGASRDGGYFQS